MSGFSSDHEEKGWLSAGFGLAAQCPGSFANGLPKDLRPGPSPVRCWPHHFDIATCVALESGDPERERGIGTGLSPGDGTYGQPYFHVNP